MINNNIVLKSWNFHHTKESPQHETSYCNSAEIPESLETPHTSVFDWAGDLHARHCSMIRLLINILCETADMDLRFAGISCTAQSKCSIHLDVGFVPHVNERSSHHDINDNACILCSFCTYIYLISRYENYYNSNFRS